MQEKNFKVRISGLSISVFLLMLYAYSTSFWKYIYQTGFLRNGTLYMVIGYFACYMLTAKYLTKVSKTHMLILLSMLFLTINNKDVAHRDIYYIRGIIPMVMLVLVPKKDDGWINVGQRMIVLVTLSFAFFTIWFSYDMEFYKSYILPIFDESSQQQLSYSLNRGASAGLTKNYSINATFIAEGILSLFCYLVFQNKRKIGIVLLALSMLSLLLTGKRAHIIFLAASFLIGYFFYNSDKKKGRIFKIIAITICMGILLVIVAQFIPSVLLFYERFIETSKSGDISLGRYEYYIIAWNQFIKNPLLGIGWGGFKYVNTAYTGFKNGSYTNAHNMYLQLLSETGIIGFMLFITLFVGVFIKSVKLLKIAKCKGDNVASQRLLYALMLQAFVLLYGITGNPIYDLETMAFYLFSCAITLYYDC